MKKILLGTLLITCLSAGGCSLIEDITCTLSGQEEGCELTHKYTPAGNKENN